MQQLYTGVKIGYCGNATWVQLYKGCVAKKNTHKNHSSSCLSTSKEQWFLLRERERGEKEIIKRLFWFSDPPVSGSQVLKLQVWISTRVLYFATLLIIMHIKKSIPKHITWKLLFRYNQATDYILVSRPKYFYRWAATLVSMCIFFFK